MLWNSNSWQLSASSSGLGVFGCWTEFRIKFLELNSKMDSGRQVFTVDLLERYAAKGRGVITCMAAGNDVILLGTSKGWIIRHDFGLGDSYGALFLSIIFLAFNSLKIYTHHGMRKWKFNFNECFFFFAENL